MKINMINLKLFLELLKNKEQPTGKRAGFSLREISGALSKPDAIIENTMFSIVTDKTISFEFREEIISLINNLEKEKVVSYYKQYPYGPYAEANRLLQNFVIPENTKKNIFGKAKTDGEEKINDQKEYVESIKKSIAENPVNEIRFLQKPEDIIYLTYGENFNAYYLKIVHPENPNDKKIEKILEKLEKAELSENDVKIQKILDEVKKAEPSEKERYMDLLKILPIALYHDALYSKAETQSIEKLKDLFGKNARKLRLTCMCSGHIKEINSVHDLEQIFVNQKKGEFLKCKDGHTNFLIIANNNLISVGIEDISGGEFRGLRKKGDGFDNQNKESKINNIGIEKIKN